MRGGKNESIDTPATSDSEVTSNEDEIVTSEAVTEDTEPTDIEDEDPADTSAEEVDVDDGIIYEAFKEGGSVCYTFPNEDGYTEKLVHLDDNEKSDNITCAVNWDDGKPNWDTFQYAFYWEGPSELGSLAIIYDNSDYNLVYLSNKDYTIAMKYYWDVAPTEAQLLDSNDSNYDLMISNGQFKFHFPKDYDQNEAWNTFNSIRLLTKDETIALLYELEAKVEP